MKVEAKARIDAMIASSKLFATRRKYAVAKNPATVRAYNILVFIQKMFGGTYLRKSFKRRQGSGTGPCIRLCIQGKALEHILP